MKIKQSFGEWLPQDRGMVADWVNELIDDINEEAEQDMLTENVSMEMSAKKKANHKRKKHYKIKSKEVAEFKQIVTEDPALRLLAEQMIEQGYAYNPKNPTGKPQIHSLNLLFKLLDRIIKTAPEYMQPDAQGRGLIGFPINAVLDWCMGTQAGYAFFLHEKVNSCLNKILKKWCEFLNSPESTKVLNDGKKGWLCPAAVKELTLDEYKIDIKDKHYGFQSWNDFFTRQFKPGMRPIASPDDPYVIVNACESAAYRIADHVETNTKFWLKEQPYSLEYMLDHHEYTKDFVGGTVYQAFLSATHYHCWHSPVDGTIDDIKLISGTYYAEINEFPYDDAGPNDSQAYITHVAARAIIMIKADNEDIGMVCFMPVGMSEVSSCDVTVKIGQKVKKGGFLGRFLFGGSTHCLIFQPNVIKEFSIDAIPAPDFNDSTIQKLGSKLATAKRSEEK